MPVRSESLCRRDFLRLAGATAAGIVAAPHVSWPAPKGPQGRAAGATTSTARRRRPNFVIFFTDDQGYQDVGCFGSPFIRTPNFDRMAREGIRLTSFYAQPVCGPSRAALMTGCYPIRVAEPGNTKGGHTVLHPKEITLAEVLKAAGYATALIGKWHLAGGRRKKYPPALMPNAQGFDAFFGTPLHNGFTRTVNPRSFRTQLMRDGEIIDDFLDQPEMNALTQRYTAEAVAFIRRNKHRPFFLYLSHNMPHVPLGASEKFRGRSKRGLYGDVIEELDWSAAEIIKTLKTLGLDEDTLVLFTSDNGPWIEKHIGDYGGSADPLRGAKMMTWDGGLRVPCIVRWPGRIPAGTVSDELVATLDVLPTFAQLAGTAPPDDRIIDGRDVSDILFGRAGAKSPHEAFFFYCYTHLQAVRSGKWKLVLPRPARPPWCSWSARMVDAVEKPQLYDLDEDIGESRDVADRHPRVVAGLMKLVRKARDDLGDYDRIGRGARFFDPGPKRPDMNRWKRRRRPPRTQPTAVYNHPEPLGSLRFDFETGDLRGWVVVEGEFESIISDRPRFHHALDRGRYNKQGRYFLSTLERAKSKAGRHTRRGNDAQTGVIESPVFVLRGEAASFLVGGGAHPNTYVALCTADGKEVLRASGRSSEIMRRVKWDTRKYVGRRVFLRVVDRNRGPWGHVTFDDFSTEGAVDADATRKRRRAQQPASRPK